VNRVTATTIRQIELELEKARAWPSVARSDFLNLAFAALRSLSSAMACSCDSANTMFGRHGPTDKHYRPRTAVSRSEPYAVTFEFDDGSKLASI
jgi:hypothetical protein